MSVRWLSMDRALLGATLLVQAGIIGWLGYDKWSERRANARPELQTALPASMPVLTVAHPLPRPARALHHPLDDPFFASASDMRRQMNRMMADAMQTFEQLNAAMYMDQGWDTLPASPTMDMRVLGDCYEVTFSLPGCNPSNVSVNLEGRLLTVASSSGESSASQHQFQRLESRVQLPGPVGDPEKTKVEFTNGVLRLTIPRGTETNNQVRRTRLI